jgi:hypothetical protein
MFETSIAAPGNNCECRNNFSWAHQHEENGDKKMQPIHDFIAFESLARLLEESWRHHNLSLLSFL